MGYDASPSTVPKSGYAIHHPSGNYAHVSTFNTTACALRLVMPESALARSSSGALLCMGQLSHLARQARPGDNNSGSVQTYPNPTMAAAAPRAGATSITLFMAGQVPTGQ